MLIATDLYKSYGKQEILHGVSLQLARGEFVSIMGESGSGKSTLLNILAGNLAPDRGSVMLDGVQVSALSERELAKFRRTSLGFVYQSLNLVPTLQARDNILLPIYLDRGDVRAAEKRMLELVDFLRVGDQLDSYPEEMSGGQRQRVAIARALLHDPKILMLDEPTGRLDSSSTAQVMELLVDINRRLGVSVIQVTHSAAAAAYGGRVVELCDGRVVEK